MRLLLRLAVSLALTLPLLATWSVATASTCADCEGAVVASGRVTHRGVPAASARVELHAWPPAEAVAADARGSAVLRAIVAAGVTDGSGRYSLRLDPASVAAFRSRSGSVDLELVASYDGSTRSVPFSASPEGKGPAPKWSPTGSADLNRFDVELDGGTSVPADGADLCGHVELGRWFYGNREKFMNVHNWPGAKATVEQAIEGTSSHELGIAAKYPGKVWQPQGTLSLSQSASSGSGARVTGIVNKAIYNSVNYREVIYKTWSSHEECYRMRRPMSFYDLLSEPHTDITHVNFRKGCTIRRGGEIWKDSQKNQTFKAGVDLEVINLSAQSGYTAGTRVGFTITRPTRICTNSEQGWLEATKFDLRSARKPRPGAA